RSAQCADGSAAGRAGAAGHVLRRLAQVVVSRWGCLAADYPRLLGPGGLCGGAVGAGPAHDEAAGGMHGMALAGFLRRVLNIGRKEFLIILKDPANRAILFGPVLVQSLLFGYAATFDLNNIPYVLLDQSRTAASAELAARLDGSGLFHRVATLTSSSQIAELVATQQALLAVQIGPRFEAQLQAGAAAPVQAIVDARNFTTAANAVGYLGRVVQEFNEDWGERHGGAKPPLTVVTRAWYNPNLETRWSLLPTLI